MHIQVECHHFCTLASTVDTQNIYNILILQHLNLQDNPVVMIMVSVIAGLYLIVLIWAKRRDMKDLRQISVVPLCGKDGSFKYEITVITGRQRGAGNTSKNLIHKVMPDTIF